MYFNVNLKLLTNLINSAFVGECVNCVDVSESLDYLYCIRITARELTDFFFTASC